MRTKPSILIIDDVPDNLHLLMQMLPKDHYFIRPATNGRRGLEAAFHEPPDLILLDIKMPDLCGEEVCRELRANPAFSTVPIVAYTAHAMQADIDRFLENGFSAVAIKPVSIQGLKDVVRGLFPDGTAP